MTPEEFVNEVLRKADDEKVFELMKDWLEEEKERWWAEITFSTKETWDLCLTCGFTDRELDKLRFRMMKKLERLGRVFKCSRQAGRERRDEFEKIRKRLKMQVTDDEKGVYCSVEEAMKWVIELYERKEERKKKPAKTKRKRKRDNEEQEGRNPEQEINQNEKPEEEKKIRKWKISMDGKKTGNEKVEMVMVGITPFGVEGVSVQSCYGVFPVALICGTENTEDVKNKLKGLWEELTMLQERKVIELDIPDTTKETETEKGRVDEIEAGGGDCGSDERGSEDGVGVGGVKDVYRFEFDVVADLKMCWLFYEFGGPHVEDNCPYCDVCGPVERMDMAKDWKTWSRAEDVKGLFGVGLDCFCICTLHMLLRIVEFFVQWLYNKMKKKCLGTLALTMIQKVGVGFKVYEKQKGGEDRLSSPRLWRFVIFILFLFFFLVLIFNLFILTFL